ncbi:MAG TPA: tRNA pseudouridine(13) synthase TruD, partial [Tepidisphaeraceae bacterium]|nr:tRNA pseudouridine(13) synthase TruD [Tepidisphaeraceae bacterium]
AILSVDRKIRELWMSAAQSRVFDAVVASRIDSLGTLVKGDLAYLHDRGACFVVEDPTVEQPRADRFEISPTGPMFGSRMTNPKDDALQSEQRIFSEFKVPTDLSDAPNGERRPLRVKPEDCALSAGVDDRGGFIAIAFTLPPGSFATTLMREVMKSGSTVSSSEQSS